MYTFFKLTQKEWLIGTLPSLLLGKRIYLTTLDISNHSTISYDDLISINNANLEIDTSQITQISTKTKLK